MIWYENDIVGPSQKQKLNLGTSIAGKEGGKVLPLKKLSIVS